jgi:hypothetical protein
MASQLINTEENKVGRVRKRKVSKDQVELLLEAERVAAELPQPVSFPVPSRQTSCSFER